MAWVLGSNISVSIDHLDITPETDSVTMTRKTSKVGQLSIWADFDESNTIGLADDTEFAALVAPAPDIVTLALYIHNFSQHQAQSNSYARED